MRRVLPFLALLLFGLSAVAGEKRNAAEVPLYPGASLKNYQGVLRANSIPIDAQVFETADDLETVLTFYRQALAHHGQYLVEHHFNTDLAYIGFWDQKDERMKLATLIRLSPKLTWIVLSGMDPRGLVQPVDLPDDLPTVAGARDVTTTSSQERGGGSQTITFRVEGQTAEKVREEMARDAEAKGWRRPADPFFAERGLLVFEKSGRRCVVQLITRQEGSRSLVVVSMIMMEENGKGEKAREE